MQEKCSLRDCSVGPDFTVPDGAEYRDEILATGKWIT